MSQVIPQSTDPSVRYLSTAQAYDLWASVYDTDGNFLQALDTMEMKTLLPRMLSLMESIPQPWTLVDLGCGTGRNTAALLDIAQAKAIGLDVSPGMLQVAAQRLQPFSQGEGGGRLKLRVFDMINESSPPAAAIGADGVVSTLVIEHVPADVFFRHVARMLKPGGILLLTNMHADMGSISQAGFVDTRTGEKIRPTSYAHTVADVRAAAAENGLEVLGQIEERTVDRDLVPLLGERSEKWVGVTVWFGGLFRKTT